MPGVTLKSLVGPRSQGLPSIVALLHTVGPGIAIVDPLGKVLLGDSSTPGPTANARIPVELERTTLGFVVGSLEPAKALASLLTHLAARESEARALASEVLHLYREVHLIEQLSEQLSALLNLPAVGQSALAQAQRLIPATHGSVLLLNKADGFLERIAYFGEACNGPGDISDPLGTSSGFVASILDRGIGEIVNNCVVDPRAAGSECTLKALMCAPLHAGQRTVGVIALADSNIGASYSSADLKLLNTIALQTAAAIENSLLCAEMVETARERTAYAAELQAASTVQQLLLQSASRSTPGFHVDSVYLPASEVGGDFFFVSPTTDGFLTVIVGDVSGKGLPAAMRVAMILGALHSETSHNPGEILRGLNNALIAQGPLGFTTACCIHISPTGEYTLANAGHISPYISGHEVTTPPALPLGILPEQKYDSVNGFLTPADRIVILSDGIPEARSQTGELYGFERLPALTLMTAQDIAETAQRFGQEDDITVLTLSFAKN